MRKGIRCGDREHYGGREIGGWEAKEGLKAMWIGDGREQGRDWGRKGAKGSIGAQAEAVAC
jgi:hypothetical protein